MLQVGAEKENENFYELFLFIYLFSLRLSSLNFIFNRKLEK